MKLQQKGPTNELGGAGTHQHRPYVIRYSWSTLVLASHLTDKHRNKETKPVKVSSKTSLYTSFSRSLPFARVQSSARPKAAPAFCKPLRAQVSQCASGLNQEHDLVIGHIQAIHKGTTWLVATYLVFHIFLAYQELTMWDTFFWYTRLAKPASGLLFLTLFDFIIKWNDHNGNWFPKQILTVLTKSCWFRFGLFVFFTLRHSCLSKNK